MPSESQLEKYIKDFVYAKIFQRVYLQLGDDISIRLASVAAEGELISQGDRKRGSTFLASFWANVIQHELNYPPSKFHYRKHKENGKEYLDLETKEVRFQIDMSRGTLTLKGQFVYDWFTTKFRNLLDNFDESFQKTWKYLPTQTGDLPGPNTSVEEAYWKSETEAYLLLENRGQKIGPISEQKFEKCSESIATMSSNQVLKDTVSSSLSLNQKLNSLTCGGLYSGPNYIYPLLCSVLHNWMQQRDSNVYISTPQLDVDRLQDFVEIYIEHRDTAQLKAFFVSYKCDLEASANINNIQKKILDKYEAHLKTFIEYNIFRKMTHPLNKFSSTFVASVKNGSAMVLLTSANLHRSHVTDDVMASLIYITMTDEEFQRMYIVPLEETALSTMSLY